MVSARDPPCSFVVVPVSEVFEEVGASFFDLVLLDTWSRWVREIGPLSSALYDFGDLFIAFGFSG